VSRLDLAPDTGSVVNPATGEKLSLAQASTEALAGARDALVYLGRQRTEAIAMLDEEIARRTDQAIRAGRLTQYTFTAGAFKVSVSSPTAGGKVRAGELRAALLADRDRLGLTAEAIAGMFTPKTTYTLRRAAWNALVKQVPKLTEYLELHTEEPPRRTAKVERNNLIETTARTA
jgi:hypothetical protein